jgi:malonyl-CoA O-methyltransferase
MQENQAVSMSAPIDVQRVRSLFSDPERTAPADFLRREIAQRMHERLDLIKLTPQVVLDAGCGDGADLAMLAQRFAQAQVLGLDGSVQQLMCAQARASDQQGQSALQKVFTRWLPAFAANAQKSPLICGDFAHLPLKNQSVDLLWSNLALHWHPQPDRVLLEWQRSVRENGLLMFSCFGPDTFRQLRNAFLQAGIAGGHVLPFVDMHDLGDMMVAAGFAAPVMDMEMLTVTYNDVEKLLADLRAFGGNPLQDRRRGLLGKRAAQRLWQALEAQSPVANADQTAEKSKYCMSFEVIYGHAFRPVARRTAAGEAIVRFSPSSSKS